METMTLEPFGVHTSRLAFGCAGLLRLPSGRERQALLSSAFDHGIRHFDVARMYGLGKAESELGRFARGRRDQMVLATKYGIQPPAGSASVVARVQAPARWLLARFPALRRHARRGAEAMTEARRYDAATARASLETSLRELGTDYVDILFLHEPEPRQVSRTEDICAYLEDARQQGRLRAWGVSGEAAPTAAVMQELGVPLVAQVRDDALLRARERWPGELPPPLLTFGPLSRALDVVLAHTRATEERAARWRTAVGADCTDADTVAALLLRAALRANRTGVVIFSTTRRNRVTAAVRAADDGDERDDPALDAFERLIESELRPADAQQSV